MYLQTLVKTTSPALTVEEAEISSSTCASKYIGPLRHQLNEPVIMWQSEVFLWSRSLTEPSQWKLKETHRSCRFINEAIFGGSPGGLSGKMDHVKRITLLLSSGWTSDVFLFEMNQHEEKEADDHRQWSTELSRFGEVNQALCECRWTCEYVEWVLMWCDVMCKYWAFIHSLKSSGTRLPCVAAGFMRSGDHVWQTIWWVCSDPSECEHVTELIDVYNLQRRYTYRTLHLCLLLKL